MCIFCSIARHEAEAHIVFENDNVIAFLDIAPIQEGHVLVIPKVHYLDADEIPGELLHEIMDVSKNIIHSLKKTYHPDGYSVMQNGGKFNDIGHYHMHIFPRYDHDAFGWTEPQITYKANADIAVRINQNLWD